MGDLLKNPLTSLIEAAGGIIGKFVTDPSEKLKAQLELTRIQNAFEIEVIKADVEFAKAQANVITEESKAGGLAAAWRPILMLTFTYIIAHNFVIAPVFHLTAVPIPPDMWDLLRIGVGGYIAGRSLEKVATIAAPALVAKGNTALDNILSKK